MAASVAASKWNCLLFVQAWLQLYEGFPALLHRPTSGQSAKGYSRATNFNEASKRQGIPEASKHTRYP